MPELIVVGNHRDPAPTREAEVRAEVAKALHGPGLAAAPLTTTDPRLRKFVNAPRSQDIETEIGTTGLRQFGGYVLEEWLQQLQGRRAAWAYREMLDNDPVVGAIMFAIEMLARGVKYRVEGGDAQRAEFIEENMNDMSHTWLDFISEALSMLPYGWAYHELVYKRRNGPRQPLPPIDEFQGAAETEENPSHAPASSEFKDGKIGWRKIPVRAQETLLKWHFDGYSGIRAMEQIDWHGGDHTIPIEKALLFRLSKKRNNPEGRSILRNSWTSFYKLSNIQQIEAIGIERDLAGIPVAKAPEGVDIYSKGNEQLRKEVQELVMTIRKDEDQGVVLPAGWELELLTTAGARMIDTDQVIRRYEQRIASSILADFVLIGQDAVGSYAMVDIKSELFGIAINTILGEILNTVNEHAIPRLLALNGMKIEDPPRITASSAGRIDLEKVGRFLQAVALAGGPIPWSKEMMEELFAQVGLPAVFPGGTLETEGHPLGPVHPPGLEQQNGVRGQGNGADARERNLRSPQAKEAPSEPPHYRPAESDAVACETCRMNDHGLCWGYGNKLIDPAYVCDSWEHPQVQKSDAGVAKTLGTRAMLLSNQLEQEMQGALADLGEEASTYYLYEAQKAQFPKRNVERTTRRVMNRLAVKGWIEGRLLPIIRNHAARTAMDAQRIIKQETGLELHLDDETMQNLQRAAGGQLRVADIEPQIHAAIAEAVREGLEKGDSPLVTARRIREAVPAGRFTGAGSTYRAQLIARNETANLQREATLGLYKSNPNVKAVILRDGIYGPPRSDQTCIERNGERVPIEQADRVMPYHPLCTLGFDPVIEA